jgi:hypothetical protein
MDETSHIPRREKCCVLLFAWLVVFLALLVWGFCYAGLDSALSLVPSVWLFPQGLAAEIFGMDYQGNPWVLLVAGWLAYFAVTFAALSAQRRPVYYILFGILCLMLLFNFVGCRKLLINF